MSAREEIVESKSGSLRQKVMQTTTNQLRRELAPVITALKQNQVELQLAVRQIERLLQVQQEPWRKAGTMLWGMAVGILLFALFQSEVRTGEEACSLDQKVITVLSE